jgi:hypothetical protein
MLHVHACTPWRAIMAPFNDSSKSRLTWRAGAQLRLLIGASTEDADHTGRRKGRASVSCAPATQESFDWEMVILVRPLTEWRWPTVHPPAICCAASFPAGASPVSVFVVFALRAQCWGEIGPGVHAQSAASPARLKMAALVRPRAASCRSRTGARPRSRRPARPPCQALPPAVWRSRCAA